ncbi:MAG: tetratricopeptide repeat protein [Candidatus Tectimicrobiota bacterium]
MRTGPIAVCVDAHERRLGQRRPLQDVASTLHNVGILSSSIRRFSEAEAAYREALAIYLQLAQAHPVAYLSEIATALTNLAVLYNHVNRLPEAEAAYQEALTLRRQLARRNPRRICRKSRRRSITSGPSTEVATTLGNLALLYSQMGWLSTAEAAYQEVLALRRQLVHTNSTAALPDVATTLTSLAGLALAQSRPQDAAAWIREAMTIRRALWQHDPATYGDVLAQSLEMEAVLLHQTDAEASTVWPGCTRLPGSSLMPVSNTLPTRACVRGVVTQATRSSAKFLYRNSGMFFTPPLLTLLGMAGENV